MAKHEFTLEVWGGTREQAEAFLQALFFDENAKAPTMVGALLDQYIDKEAGVSFR